MGNFDVPHGLNMGAHVAGGLCGIYVRTMSGDNIGSAVTGAYRVTGRLHHVLPLRRICPAACHHNVQSCELCVCVGRVA